MESQGTVHSIAEYRELARRTLPKMIFDFYDGGAEGEKIRVNTAEGTYQERA